MDRSTVVGSGNVARMDELINSQIIGSDNFTNDSYYSRIDRSTVIGSNMFKGGRRSFVTNSIVISGYGLQWEDEETSTNFVGNGRTLEGTIYMDTSPAHIQGMYNSLTFLGGKSNVRYLNYKLSNSFILDPNSARSGSTIDENFEAMLSGTAVDGDRRLGVFMPLSTTLGSDYDMIDEAESESYGSGSMFQVNGGASKASAGSWNANSDSRLKKNIVYMNSEAMLAKVLEMKGVSYEWNDDKTGWERPEGVQYGFIAQDLLEVWPEKVTKGVKGYYETAYGDYDPMFVEAIKALNNKISNLKNENSQLESKNNALQEELENLSQSVKVLTERVKVLMQQVHQN